MISNKTGIKYLEKSWRFWETWLCFTFCDYLFYFFWHMNIRNYRVFFIECLSYSQWVLFCPKFNLIFNHVQSSNCDPLLRLGSCVFLVLCPLTRIPAWALLWQPFHLFGGVEFALACFCQNQCLHFLFAILLVVFRWFLRGSEDVFTLNHHL